jgi:tRNA A37 threonylcarbamoyladenosine modification protein TsaB
MILFINTSDYEQVQLALVGKSIVWHKFNSRNLSEQLLAEIKKFCKKQKIGLSQLKKIAVVAGPGLFSRIRTAVATANALGFGLNIQVLGLNKNKVPENLSELEFHKNQKMTKPIYDKNPSITLKK